jgi:hypothetical protein
MMPSSGPQDFSIKSGQTVTGPDFRLVKLNPTVFDILDYSSTLLTGLPILDCEHPLALDRQQGQNASRIGACIDIDPVRSNFRLGDGGMTVHNKFAKVFLALKELIPDPKQIFFSLLSQRHAGLDASVRKKEISARKARS